MKRLSISFSIFLLLLGLSYVQNNIQAAEKYPVKPVTFIVPAEAGSEGDVMARQVCKKASTLLGQPVMVVNKPGGGGSIAYRELHDAKPDGYTIGGAYASICTNRMQGILPYDHEEFSVIGSLYFTYPILVASTKTQRPFKTFEEVLSAAKSNPGEISIATSGVGYVWWLATMDFLHKTGLKFNIIPQSGTSGLATTQATGGHTDLSITGLGASKSLIDSGMVRLLLVWGPERNPTYPNVRTLKEMGYGIGVGSFEFAVGPPRISKDIMDYLDKAFGAAVNDQEYQRFAVERNLNPTYLPPEKAKNYLDGQRRVFRPILEAAGILKEK